MRPIAILRPEPGASATSNRAREAGLEAFKLPLFQIEPLPWTLPPGDYDGVLLTSANAARHLGRELRTLEHLPVFTVGPETAAAATAAGLSVARVGDEGADALLATLPSGLRLLHPCGEHRHIPSAPTCSIDAVAVYRSAEVPHPPGLEHLRGSVALVHSARAGRRLAELVEACTSIAIVAISPAAAEACGSGWQSVQAANAPSDKALLSLAARLCKQSAPK